MEKFDIKKIDASNLEIFLKVFELQSLSATADYFGMNQSTISHVIRKMEKSLGEPLFFRVGRNISPTHAAVNLAPISEEILVKFQSLTRIKEFDAESDNRTITIAANVMELLPDLTRLSKVLQNEVPNAPVRILELGSRENLLDTLSLGKADVAICVRPNHLSPLLNFMNLISDPVRIFYDHNLRAPVKDIDDYFEAKHATLDFGGEKKSTVSKMLASFGRERRIAIGISNVYALAEMMKGTDFITTMQSRLSKTAFSEFRSVKPPFETHDVKFDLVWHKRDDREKRNKWLRQVVFETFTYTKE